MNKKIMLLILLIVNFALSANAQRLVNGGKPKLFKTENGVKTYEIKFPNGVFVRKTERENEDAENGKFYVGIGGKAFEAGDASIGAAGSADNFYAFYGDLDKNKSAELVVVDFDGQSNGLGVSYYTVSIFPDFQTKGFQPPVSFSTEEFGAQGTFLYDVKTNETLILITDFNGLENISKKEGTYFVGRYFRYQNGLLKPATDKPLLARRYTNSFETERLRSEKNPLRPFLWLDSPKAQKLRNDPEFGQTPVASQNGVIEKYERSKGDRKNEDGEIEHFSVEQIIVKFDSGATQTIILAENKSGQAQASDEKIRPEIFGILPAKISLPQGISLTTVFDRLEGRKIMLNTYPPFAFDEAKKPRYKVLIGD